MEVLVMKGQWHHNTVALSNTVAQAEVLGFHHLPSSFLT